MDRIIKAASLVSRFLELVADYDPWEFGDASASTPNFFQIHIDSLLGDKALLTDYLETWEDDEKATALLAEVIAF